MTTNHAEGVARQGDVRQKGNIELRLASRAGAQLRCRASGHPTSIESPGGRLAWLNFSRHGLDATTSCFLLFFREGRKDYRAAMKRIFISLALVCAASARADLVTQQQITTPNDNGVVAIKIKGTKIRMDMYAGQPQALSTITDLNTGETINLMHTQKLFVKTPGTPM